MSKHFKDPIAVKERKASASFAAPTKERATTGRWMNAGDNYGVGHRNPVGSENVKAEGPIHRKSFCFDPSDAIL